MIEPLSLQKKGDKEAGTAGRKCLAWTCQALTAIIWQRRFLKTMITFR